MSISQTDIDKLDLLRLEAHELGVLKRSKGDFVTCNVKFKNEAISGKVRLKGDWVDHLKDHKWSFRVKLKDSLQDGIKVFSLQSPETRSFLKGYVFHQLLRKHDILSPKMTFVELMVNGESWGIYNFEEHLSIDFTNRQGRGEGMILSFDDEHFFDAVLNKQKLNGLIAEAEIKVKAGKKLKKDAILLGKAIGIAENYQNQTDSVYNDFNSEKMATYYAICDLARAYHAMGWINIRFFFDIKTQLMEPIGYDGYPTAHWGEPFLGHQAKKAKTTKNKLDHLRVVYSALYHKKIEMQYYKQLAKLIDPKSLTLFMESLKSDLDFFEQEIQKEFTTYKYDRLLLLNNAQEIQTALVLEK